MNYEFILEERKDLEVSNDVNLRLVTDPGVGYLTIQGGGCTCRVPVILVGSRDEHNKHIGGYVSIHRNYLENTYRLVRYGGAIGTCIYALERALLRKLCG